MTQYLRMAVALLVSGYAASSFAGERDKETGQDLVALSTSEIGQKLITLQLDDEPVQAVIERFTKLTGANIVYDEREVQGNVTVSLKDVEWEAALRVILDSVNYQLQKKANDVFLIVPNDRGTTDDSMSFEQFGQVLSGEYIASHVAVLKRIMRDKDLTDALAEFQRNYYDALIGRGFSKDEAMRLLLHFNPQDFGSME